MAIDVTAAPAPTQSRPDPAAAGGAPDTRPGIYLLGADGAAGTRLTVSTTDTLEMKGTAKAIISQGFLKPTTVARHAGSQAALTVTDASLVFLFQMPPPMNTRNQASLMAAMEHMDEDAPPVMSTHAREFALVRLTVDGDTRILDTGARKIKLKIDETGDRQFRVAVVDPLEPGEYAFYLADQRKGGSPAQIWAFSKR
jgi:hypothetical protein